MSDPKPLVVVGLAAEQVKRIRAVEIKPPRTGVVEIAGRNGQGKSSVLDSIVMALGGKKAQPEMPVRKGEKGAKVVVELDDLVVTRTWTEKNDYLTVEQYVDVAGQRMKAKVSSPQAFLDKLVGAGLGFDPTEFVRLKPGDQAELLLRLLQLPEDPRQLDLQRAALVTERTTVNREVRRLEGVLASSPEVEAPDEEVSVVALAARLDELRGIERENARVRSQIAVKTGFVDGAQRRIAEINEKIADLKLQLETQMTALEQELQGHGAAVVELQRVETEVAQLVDPVDEIADVQRQLSTAEATNTSVRAKAARAKTTAELKTVEAQSIALTEKITAVDERKTKLIAAAPFPIPGLGFADVGGSYVVTYEDVPLSQASSALRMRVGLAIAMALNPTVRVVLLREGSLLDDDARAELERVAAERGFQVWLEIVGKGKGDGFVIEDGGVVKATA